MSHGSIIIVCVEKRIDYFIEYLFNNEHYLPAYRYDICMHSQVYVYTSDTAIPYDWTVCMLHFIIYDRPDRKAPPACDRQVHSARSTIGS